jgi:hypothetical protein
VRLGGAEVVARARSRALPHRGGRCASYPRSVGRCQVSEWRAAAVNEPTVGFPPAITARPWTCCLGPTCRRSCAMTEDPNPLHIYGHFRIGIATPTRRRSLACNGSDEHTHSGKLYPPRRLLRFGASLLSPSTHRVQLRQSKVQVFLFTDF